MSGLATVYRAVTSVHKPRRPSLRPCAPRWTEPPGSCSAPRNGPGGPPSRQGTRQAGGTGPCARRERAAPPWGVGLEGMGCPRPCLSPSCLGLWPLCLPLCEDRCVSQDAQCVAPRRDSEGAVSFRRRALRLARRPRRDFRKPGDLTCRGAVPSEQEVHMHTHTHTHRHVRARTPV